MHRRLRQLDLTLSVLQLPFDLGAMLLAALSAYALRFSPFFLGLRPLLQTIPFVTYISRSLLFALAGLLVCAIAGLYSIKPRPVWSEFGRVIVAVTATIMLVIATVFFRRELTTSRFLVLAVWPLAALYVWIGRLLLRLVRRILLQHQVGHERIVIIGQNKTAQDLRQLYRTRPTLGFTVFKTIKTWSKPARHEIEELVHQNRLDGILLAEPDLPKDAAMEIITFCENNHLTFRYLADLFAARFTHIDITANAGIPMIEVKRTPLDGWGRIAKRTFDVVASSLLIILFSPLMLATALAVKLDSRGPVFYQLDDDSPPERVGERGRPFRYLKFRSMFPRMHMLRYKELKHLDLRKDDPLVKIKNDPRVTRVGRFIRKWSIDELPELILVWLGRMSLVGPRPHLPEEVAQYKPAQRRVLSIKPGITGLAQISGRSDLSFDEEVRVDAWYIEHWSLWLDLSILLKTPWAVIIHRGMEEGV